MVNKDAHRWLEALRDNLQLAQDVRLESFDEFLHRPEVQLSYEALIIRVGDLAKRLSQNDSGFNELATIQRAAKTRDFVAHHYHRIDLRQLWLTVESFRELDQVVDEAFCGMQPEAPGER